MKAFEILFQNCVEVSKHCLAANAISESKQIAWLICFVEHSALIVCVYACLTI
jgi:hypothetical protein